MHKTYPLPGMPHVALAYLCIPLSPKTRGKHDQQQCRSIKQQIKQRPTAANFLHTDGDCLPDTGHLIYLEIEWANILPGSY